MQKGGNGFQSNERTVILEDINECHELSGVCQNGRCTNTFGSYMCACNEGFRLDSRGVLCEDKNECLESDDNPCGEGGSCVNIEGSFECYCQVKCCWLLMVGKMFQIYFSCLFLEK